MESCNPADTGTVETLLSNQFGCDSLVVTSTFLLPSDTTFIDLQSCNPADTGTVETLLSNQFGCDSLIVTTTSLLSSDTTFIDLQSCNPVDTGTVETLLNNQFGCDSLVVTNTSLLPSDTIFIDLQSCNPADTGTVETLLTNQFGCDSLIITNTFLLPSDTTFIDLESCNSVDTGTVETLLSNQFGCDSLVVTNTSLLPSDTIFIDLQSCNPADTGTVETLLSNQFGCDSLIITITSLLSSDTTFIDLESCNPVDTGTVETLLSNQFGCDSLIITNTSLLPSDTTFIDLESCNPVDTGTVETLLTNQFGCDSLIITNTSLLPSDTTFIDLESCNPVDTGTVETLLTNQFGCDSLIITNTSLLPSDTTFIDLQSCNPADTGMVETLLSNQFGCDSLIITTTSLLPNSATLLNPSVCPGDSILINGQYYSASNPSGVDTLSNTFGCDSLVIINLEVLAAPAIQSIDSTICVGESITISNQIFNLSNPTGTITLAGQNGCDSLIIAVDLSFSEPTALIQAVAPPCEGFTGGAELFNVTNGVPPYTYRIGTLSGEVVDSAAVFVDGLFPGLYDLVLSDAIGCTTFNEVNIPEGVPASVTLGVDIDTILGAEITLSPTFNFNYDSLIWQPASLLSCDNCLTPSLTTIKNVLIQLTAFNEDGCLAEDELLIRVDKRRKAYIPNAFSPNNDGINDFFTIFADPTQVSLIKSLSIFDRWGDQVFIKQNFPPNLESEGWDGRFRRKPMNSAVFVYYAELEYTDGETILFKGEVQLLR